MSTRPKVLAYYFPDYHRDARNAGWFGDGWTEWEVVRAAIPRFPGHTQPIRATRGHEDESDPRVAGEYIELASSHGIDGFIFDYYWYDDGPYLEGALADGFLLADNPDGFEFSLMWANHDLLDIFPRRNLRDMPPLLKQGAVGREAFERMALHILDAYFGQPAYTTIDGRPRFSIYEVGAFVRGLGGVEEARAALQWFDERAIERGFPGIHFDAVVWGFSVLPAELPIRDAETLLPLLGFRSASSYVWVHHTDTQNYGFPFSDEWSRVIAEAFADYERLAGELPVPFHPNVTCGWDASPRVDPDAAYARDVLPYPPIWQATDEEFEDGLRRARDFLERHPTAHPEVTINAWNEWTEGSYLLPDTQTGTAKLEAIRRVFGPRERPDGSVG